MDSKKTKKGNKECEILLGDGGLKDILLLLKEQSKKLERLGMAFKAIQNGMRQNTPTTIKTRVGEVAEVLSSLFKSHECLIKSEGLPVLRRHLEGNEGESRPSEGRTRGPVYPEDQEEGSPSSPQKGGIRFGLL